MRGNLIHTYGPPGQGPIGVFDSGYGGLTVLRELVAALPAYDYLYLGDNARAPYGTRSFETVYQYTWQAVQWFFGQGCPLVILACNTASAKALRSIQQQKLPAHAPDRRVLGVIRPTAEILGSLSRTGHTGILATQGTVSSGSYEIELRHFSPGLRVYQQACPLLVPLIENGEHHSEGGRWFARRYTEALMEQQPHIDTVLMACTHYPLIESVLRQFLPPHIQLVGQGHIVADSLKDYLQRHTDMELRLTRSGSRQFVTTEPATDFDQKAAIFYGSPTHARQVHIS